MVISKAVQKTGGTYTTKISVCITPDDADRLGAIAHEENVSLSDVIRHAIGLFLGVPPEE